MLYIIRYVILSTVITSLHNIKYLYFVILFVIVKIKLYLIFVIKFLNFNNLTMKFIVTNFHDLCYCDINYNIL
jgi:hypothetical protein